MWERNRGGDPIKKPAALNSRRVCSRQKFLSIEKDGSYRRFKHFSKFLGMLEPNFPSVMEKRIKNRCTAG